MLLILQPNTDEDSEDYHRTLEFLRGLPRVEARVHVVQGQQQKLTEIYLIGDTHALDRQEIESLPGVERVVRISEEYRVLGRHKDEKRLAGFEYNGVTFSQENLNVMAGLCAVDNPKNVEAMMRALQENGQVCTRMGAYKPRTNPYSFQGHGKSCLPYVFELAGKYGIEVIAMEVTHESHLEEISEGLRSAGDPTGVIVAQLERKSVLSRPDPYGKLKPVAANIDQIMVVIAPLPEPHAMLIDRYLVAAETVNIEPVILLNVSPRGRLSFALPRCTFDITVRVDGGEEKPEAPAAQAAFDAGVKLQGPTTDPTTSTMASRAPTS